MKTLKKSYYFLIILTFVFICSGYKNSESVYICLSPTAYAYHFDANCRGFKQCTHDTKKVSIQQAISMGRKACGWENK